MGEMQRENDLVLNPNEYAYVLDKTKGLISCVVGSYKMSLSTSDALVVFNEKTKRFEEASLDKAKTPVIAAPENWYVVLKNPEITGKHPLSGTANPAPELQVGKKVNITGNVAFALYPGQMAKVVQGHRLHSNQYLLARVYDADVLDKIEELDKDGNKTGTILNKYAIGQLLVIKGTEVPFYIPPTGVEVIPLDEKGEKYVRDAVTLEKLEYCILKNEQGEKKYIHGSAVVFPEPDEKFIRNRSNGSYKFKAIELSDISGVYIKVIADYKDEITKEQYKAGQELFITGKDQMIYYPRPEHAIIDYEGRVLHHAIAIPEGEGRYVLDRNTGDVKMVKGPAMYLPDPRNEVIVRRKLTEKQCHLWFPENEEVLLYNAGISEGSPCAAGILDEDSKMSVEIPMMLRSSANVLDHGFLGQEHAIIEDAGFSRGNTYSKPRTILIDNKYDGVVSIDIWTGYAINVISKNGKRKVVTGPQTYLLEYDETLEVLELSTGKPKTTDHLLKTVYLRIDNNKISDIIHVQTKDFVAVDIEVSYCVDFLRRFAADWFKVEDYVKYMTDRQRSFIKREVRKLTVEEFYENAPDIVRRVALDIPENNIVTNLEDGKAGRLFRENGMFVHDVEVLSLTVEQDIKDIIDEHQKNMVRKSLEWSNVNKEVEIAEKIADAKKREADLNYESKSYKLTLEKKMEEETIKKEEAIKRMKETAELAAKTAVKELQNILDDIQKSELARQKEIYEQEIRHQKELDALSAAKQKAYMEAVQGILSAVTPDLIASMTSSANAELLKVLAESMSPYAMAGNSGESIVDITTKLLHGTSLEEFLQKVPIGKEENLVEEK